MMLSRRIVAEMWYNICELYNWFVKQIRIEICMRLGLFENKSREGNHVMPMCYFLIYVHEWLE